VGFVKIVRATNLLTNWATISFSRRTKLRGDIQWYKSCRATKIL